MNVNLDNIGLLIVATSTPGIEDYGQRIAQAIGVDDGTPIRTYSMACDSSGAAVYHIAEGRYRRLLEEKKMVMIYSYEDWYRLLDQGVDPYSLQVFSTASAVTLYDSRALEFVTGNEAEIITGVECLKAKKTYLGFEHKPDFVAEHLVKPESGLGMEMDPKLTASYFGKNAVKIARRTLKKAMEFGIGVDDIGVVIAHHPNGRIFEFARKMLEIDQEKMRFVIPEGNAPAVTIPIAWGRNLERIKGGDLVMSLSYGAGGWFHSAIYKTHGREDLSFQS